MGVIRLLKLVLDQNNCSGRKICRYEISGERADRYLTVDRGI